MSDPFSNADGIDDDDSRREWEAKYRWCVHCGADCWLDEDDQEHSADCPVSHGVWPMKHDHEIILARWVLQQPNVPDDVAEVAKESALKAPVCAECHAPIEHGDHYMLRDDDTGEITPRPHVGVIVCIGCAAEVGKQCH